jgi:sugar phosphate isomerase/epimerase
MDVGCSTFAFTREPLERALRHIAELEFSKVDLGVWDEGSHLSPKDLLADADAVVQRIRQGPTIAVAAITARLSAIDKALEAQIDAVGHLAAQLTCPLVVLEAAAVGTPIENEVQRLTALTRVLAMHGVTLTVTTKMGTLTEQPDTAVELCQRVEGLGLTLDPSHFLCGPWQGKPFDQAYEHVKHVHLRDSGTRPEQLQVRVGRGAVEYGRMVTRLDSIGYRGSLIVAIEDRLAEPDVDVESEVRKLRLVLESLL